MLFLFSYHKKETHINNYMEMVKLNTLKIGECGVIASYSSMLNSKLKRRLLELGFCLGTTIRILNVSILNKVALVELNGYVLSVRKNLLKNIFVGVESERSNFIG